MSLTPATGSFLRRRRGTGATGQSAQTAGGGTTSEDSNPYFECNICHINRSAQHRSDEFPNSCVYCMGDDMEVNAWDDDAVQVCLGCLLELPYSEFRSSDEDNGSPWCRVCRRPGGDDADDDAASLPPSRSSDHVFSQSSSGNWPSSQGRRGPQPGVPYGPRPNSIPVAADLGDGVLSTFLARGDPGWEGNLDGPALWDEEQELLRKTEARLDAETVMEVCSRCSHRWFGLDIVHGVCRACRNADGDKKQDEPYLYSADNNLSLGYVPENLPPATQCEEQCIARIHVFIDVRLVRGQQYRYSRHCVSFLRDTATLFDELPRLPREMEMILLRPKSASNDPHTIRAFKKEMYIRRSVVQAWLEYLVRHHPGYRDLLINYERMMELPVDGDVSDQVTILEVAEGEMGTAAGRAAADEDEDEDEDDGSFEVAAAPEIMAVEADMQRLEGQLGGHTSSHPERPPIRALRREGAEAPARNVMELPGIRRTPLSDLNRSVALISLAMPTLMPQGLGEFVTPRVRECSWKQWVKHAMLWEDGRFARHSRFPFVAFNTIMRASVNQKASFFVKRNAGRLGDIETVDDLKNMMDSDSPEAAAVLNSIVRSADTLKGTRPFWNQMRNELQAMCHALKCPAIFLTFSAADLHWESLQRLMPNYDEWKAADDAGKMRISRKNLRENPHIAAHHFYHRFKIFFEEYLVPKLKITAHWVRFEWQGRGSTHTHGVYWVDGAPKAPLDSFLEEAQKQEFAEFWGVHVHAWNPEPGRQMPPQEDNPLKYKMGSDSSFLMLSRVLNRVQRHTCSDAYCLRRYKLPNGQFSDEKVCRFHFPRAIHPQAVVTRELSASGIKNPPWDTFDGVRNDGSLNNYIRGVSMGWMANTDASPCTSLRAVINYISKYCSKAETKTQPYQEMLKELIPKVSHAQPMVSLVAKMMNRLVSERDWPAMEVAHHLLGLPLVECSHVFVRVDCRKPDGVQRAIIQEDGAVREQKPLHEKYCQREESWSGLTYFRFLTAVNHSVRGRWQYFKDRAKPRILNYFPRYKGMRSSDQFEDFCRVKLTLHHPHTSVDELKVVDGVAFDTFAEAYDRCREVHEGAHLDDDYYGDLLPEPEDEGFEEDPGAEREEARDVDWQVIAAELPGFEADTEDVNLLGNRAVDLEYDWTPHVGLYGELYDRRGAFWKEMRQGVGAGASQPGGDADGPSRDQLNAEQRLLYDTVVGH